jgi:hypothetical protein
MPIKTREIKGSTRKEKGQREGGHVAKAKASSLLFFFPSHNRLQNTMSSFGSTSKGILHENQTKT